MRLGAGTKSGKQASPADMTELVTSWRCVESRATEAVGHLKGSPRRFRGGTAWKARKCLFGDGPIVAAYPAVRARGVGSPGLSNGRGPHKSTRTPVRGGSLSPLRREAPRQS